MMNYPDSIYHFKAINASPKLFILMIVLLQVPLFSRQV